MQNNQSPQDTNRQTTEQTIADDASLRQAWNDLARDVDQLGRKLGELGSDVSSQLAEDLQARLAEVKTRTQTCQQLTEQQLTQLRQSAWRQAGEAYGEARTRSKVAAAHVWERSEPLRLGAQDVGEGLARAWSELRVSLGKAAGRLQSETSTAPTDESRETGQ